MGKVRQISHITVGEFFTKHAQTLKIEMPADQRGFARKIHEPSVNRPGLALAGFYDYFAYKRIQVLGNSELAYLNHFKEPEMRRRFRQMCQAEIPCIVICRGRRLPTILTELVESEEDLQVFYSGMLTMKFINACTLLLDSEFAPTTSEHGCMVDVKGIGVLIRGESGLGKSEAVLGLLERGASLVADDKVQFRAPEGRELIGTAAELGRFHMEVRGIGIVNVPMLFGVGAMRIEKRLDLIVDLRPLDKFTDVDRLGTEVRTTQILGVTVPRVEIPVAPGRDTARLVETAALEQKLRSFGHHAAVEFNKNLLKMMEGKRIS